MRFKYKTRGEKSSFQKTELLKNKRFSYPEVDIYIPENIVWFDIAAEKQFLYLNKSLRIYYINQENHQSITTSIDDSKYAKGTYFYYKHLLNKHSKKIIKISYFEYFKLLYHFYDNGKKIGKSFKQINNDFSDVFLLFLTSIVHVIKK